MKQSTTMVAGGLVIAAALAFGLTRNVTAQSGAAPAPQAARIAVVDMIGVVDKLMSQGSFKAAREQAGGKIACVFECTGQPHILNAALEARTIRGEGMYCLVSCLYVTTLDIANIRRDSGVVTNLRRSRNKFPLVLKEIAANPEHYRQLLGYAVDFDDIPKLYAAGGFKGEKIGDGPKVVIRYAA